MKEVKIVQITKQERDVKALADEIAAQKEEPYIKDETVTHKPQKGVDRLRE